MILIDAIYINNGGGLVLLKYLIETIKSSDLKVFFILDDRLKGQLDELNMLNCIYISSSFVDRYKFYKNNRNKYNKVLCFGNVPPPLKLKKSKVFVYFHQPLFLEIPQDFSLINKIIYTIKQNILRFFRSNTDYWLVQSPFISTKFSTKYLKGKSDKLRILPFYPELSFLKHKKNVSRISDSFIYVSNSSPHKNHLKLIDAFCQCFDKMHSGSLTLTVPNTDIFLNNIIQEKNNLGYPIYNAGFVDREKLTELYLSHEYLIFPSLAESFGLGLVEAIDGGCKIIAADLSYTYEVCEPSLTFDPYSIESIKNAIATAINKELPPASKLIENDISKIIRILAE